MGKSIFIAVPCLGYDSELETTITSCYKNSSKEYDIYMGIPMIGNIDFFNEISNKFSDNKNITFKYYPLEDNLGVGKGRVYSQNLYSDQDYFFQIDSHTYFDNNWDSEIINAFEKAKKMK